MASGRLIDYLGYGLLSARPVAPDLYTGTLGIYYATDTGLAYMWDGATWTRAGANVETRGATWVRVGSAIEVPANDVFSMRIPFNGTIKSVTIGTQGGAGSCVVDIWKDTYANFPPTVADTITAAAKPTISAGTKYFDGTLVGWTIAVSAGDVLVFHLESSSVFTGIFLTLEIEES